MLKKNVDHIIKATKDRLVYHSVTISESSEKGFRELLDKFEDADFNTASDSLTDAIYKLLLSFGVPDLAAYRCSWKWSD
jgi:hypothetical protein